ncbi:hypothetical protein HXX01_01145 [Candidatus Nomurabacteria bacterium]|nr:hypothetical protein [Candidatus Nomurabacteria bacterium]
MNISQKLHRATFILGTLIFTTSLISAIFFSYPHFYTWFAFGGWLILDWIDYRKNKKSILGYFYNHKHRRTFLLFFIVSTITAFIIDYIYGVRLSGMWEWPAYSNIHFIRMYTIMNISYILSMYELYRVIYTYLKPFISSTHHASFNLHHHIKKIFNISGIIMGVVFLSLPLLSWYTKETSHMKYLMIMPFIGMWLSSDSITSILHGKSILGEILRGNKLQIVTLVITVLSASLFTEIINLSAHEWVYKYMPFENLQIFKIPVAVFVGWTPLVIGVIALLNMVKHVENIKIK